MKRTILTLAVLASISLTSFGTTSIQQERKGKRDLVKELNLSNEQDEQVKAINKEFGDKIKAVEKTRIAKEVQQERIKKLRDEKREAINKVLTPEQQKQFAKKTPKGGKKKPGNAKGRRGERMYSDDGMMRGEMFKDLNLTDAQKEQMKNLKEKYTQERQVANKNYKEEINKILTPEQKAKMEEKAKSFKDGRTDRRGEMRKIDKLDDATKAQFKELKEAYQKEKSAVERSRIAPEMQKQKLQILKDKFNKDKEELLNSVE